MTIVIVNNRTIDKFFGFLFKLDTKSKKKLIIKLTESIEDPKTRKSGSKSLFGSWVDDRDSDMIIKEIKESRVNSHNIAEF
jgi:hypothetical protein